MAIYSVLLYRGVVLDNQPLSLPDTATYVLRDLELFYDRQLQGIVIALKDSAGELIVRHRFETGPFQTFQWQGRQVVEGPTTLTWGAADTAFASLSGYRLL